VDKLGGLLEHFGPVDPARRDPRRGSHLSPAIAWHFRSHHARH
jgi:hypothetical protein